VNRSKKKGRSVEVLLFALMRGRRSVCEPRLDGVLRSSLIDPVRLAVGVFSDGASYALSLGIPSADLYTHVLAFSPGLEDRSAPFRGRTSSRSARNTG
jgi:predicted esterase